MFPRATIKDVARIAGVHFTTVSMALRGHPAIATRTRLRIENAASVLGYQRNAVFSALTRQRKNPRQSHSVPTILYLGRALDDRHFFKMAHHEQLLAGAFREAQALGYQLKAEVVGPSGIAPEQLQAHLAASSAVGLVIGAWDPVLEVPVVNWNRIPTVKIDSRHVAAQAPFVSFDQMKCVIDSYRQLHRLGYRRIGLALGEKDEDATDGLHLSGWLVAQMEFPRRAKIPPLFFPPGASSEDITPLLSTWIRKHQIEAILCNWRSIAQMLRAASDPVVDRVAYACLCCTPNERELAGIVPNFDLVGQRAISLLGSIINDSPGTPAAPPLTSYVDGTWRDGSSLRPKR